MRDVLSSVSLALASGVCALLGAWRGYDAVVALGGVGAVAFSAIAWLEWVRGRKSSAQTCRRPPDAIR
jgi:hypothetical protein